MAFFLFSHTEKAEQEIIIILFDYCPILGVVYEAIETRARWKEGREGGRKGGKEKGKGGREGRKEKGNGGGLIPTV